MTIYILSTIDERSIAMRLESLAETYGVPIRNQHTSAPSTSCDAVVVIIGVVIGPEFRMKLECAKSIGLPIYPCGRGELSLDYRRCELGEVDRVCRAMCLIVSGMETLLKEGKRGQ